MDFILAILLVVTGFILVWMVKPWESIYIVGKQIVDSKSYGDTGIFKVPLRKIYRNRVYSEMEYDIFCLKSCNRLTKKIQYVLTNLDDEPEIIKELKENQNG